MGKIAQCRSSNCRGHLNFAIATAKTWNIGPNDWFAEVVGRRGGASLRSRMRELVKLKTCRQVSTGNRVFCTGRIKRKE